MSITSIVYLLVFAGGLILAFRNPIFGLSVYLWAFYNNPQTRWWSDQVPDLRWSLIAAIVTLVAFAVHSVGGAGGPARTTASSSELGGSPKQQRLSFGFWCLALFACWAWIQSSWALDPQTHLEGCILFTKYVVLFFIVDRLITTERHLELFAWAHVGGCFHWGWIAYTRHSVGRFEMELGPGISDANALGFIS